MPKEKKGNLIFLEELNHSGRSQADHRGMWFLTFSMVLIPGTEFRKIMIYCNTTIKYKGIGQPK
jgi:hypothetical protein